MCGHPLRFLWMLRNYLLPLIGSFPMNISGVEWQSEHIPLCPSTYPCVPHSLFSHTPSPLWASQKMDDVCCLNGRGQAGNSPWALDQKYPSTWCLGGIHGKFSHGIAQIWDLWAASKQHNTWQSPPSQVWQLALGLETTQIYLNAT